MLRLLTAGLFLVAVTTASRGEDAPAKAPPTNPTFEKIKKLAGTWVEADKDGKPTDKVVSVVKVTARRIGHSRDAVPWSTDGDALGLPPGQRGRHDDPLLRSGESTANEGRPDRPGEPDSVEVRRRHEPGPGQGRSHARGDRHVRRRRPHRNCRRSLGGRQAIRRSLRPDEARPQEVKLSGDAASLRNPTRWGFAAATPADSQRSTLASEGHKAFGGKYCTRGSPLAPRL